MRQILYFLLTYKHQVFLAMFATIAVVAFVNFVHNPYARQNVQLKRFNKRTLRSPSSVLWETKQLPAHYQRQWRAFVNSGCAKPSIVFEFVKRPQRYLLWFAHFVAFVVCVVYFALAIWLNSQEIFATQVAFVLFSALIVLLTKLIGLINLSHARKVFGKFLHDLNTVADIVKSDNFSEQTATAPNGSTQNIQIATANPNATLTQTGGQVVESNVVSTPQTTVAQPPVSAEMPLQTPPSSTGQTADCTASNPSTFAHSPNAQIFENRGDVVEKTVQILRQKGLENPRTIEEQRKLNIALNNLLQACCKK
ncbi:MAG: hypothetical protein IJE50_05230 [Clostridia bacterium]|nr:hypothetical protein [Clostridia bacterium]